MLEVLRERGEIGGILAADWALTLVEIRAEIKDKYVIIFFMAVHRIVRN